MITFKTDLNRYADMTFQLTIQRMWHGLRAIAQPWEIIALCGGFVLLLGSFIALCLV
jgi:hypothetical protein